MSGSLRGRAPAMVAEAIVGHDALVAEMCGTTDAEVVLDRLVEWCGRALGAEVVGVPWAAASSGLVLAVDLGDGRAVVVKLRPRRQWALTAEARQVQALLAADGFAAPAPLGELEAWEPGALVGAEVRADGGASVDGHSGAGRDVLAATLHDLVGRATAVTPAGIALHEPWGIALPPEQVWPDQPHDPAFDFPGTAGGAGWIDELAGSFRQRMRDGAEGRERCVGHVDWRAEHVRIDPRGGVVAVFDWDSVVRAPEEVLAGLASSGFSIDWSQPDPYPSVAEGAAFLAAYERSRGRPFTAPERDLIDAAHGYAVAYGARCEHSDEHTGRRRPAPDGWRRLLRARGSHALA